MLFEAMVGRALCGFARAYPLFPGPVAETDNATEYAALVREEQRLWVARSETARPLR